VQDSELHYGKLERGRVRRGPGAARVKPLERREAHESNVPHDALNKHHGVTDLQSAKSLEAGPMFDGLTARRQVGVRATHG